MSPMPTRAAVTLLAALAAAPAAAQTMPAAPQVESVDEAIRQTRQRDGDQRPQPSGRIAVLDLVLDAQGRELKTARVDRVEVVSANAPKVFARSRGTWEVRLYGAETVTYRIPNPLEDIEIENPPGSASPFSRVEPDGAVPFQLAVPLTRGGTSLGVERIQLVDTVTGRVVVDTPVQR